MDSCSGSRSRQVVLLTLTATTTEVTILVTTSRMRRHHVSREKQTHFPAEVTSDNFFLPIANRGRGDRIGTAEEIGSERVSEPTREMQWAQWKESRKSRHFVTTRHFSRDVRYFDGDGRSRISSRILSLRRCTLIVASVTTGRAYADTQALPIHRDRRRASAHDHVARSFIRAPDDGKIKPQRAPRPARPLEG